VATSASIIAVFLPVGLMNSETGQWFKEFGITVAVATFFSLIVARLITPMMAAHFLRDKGQEEPQGDFVEIYRGALGFAIRNAWKTMGMGIALFVASFFLIPFVKMTFIPRFDNGIIQEQVEIPPGTTFVEADRAMRSIAQAARQVPEVQNTFTSLDGVDGS